MRKTDKRPKDGRARSPKKWVRLIDGRSIIVMLFEKWIYSGYAAMKVATIKRIPKTVLRRVGWR